MFASSLPLLLHYHIFSRLIFKSWTCRWNRRNDILCALKLNRSHTVTKPTKLPVHPAKTQIIDAGHPPSLVRVFVVRSMGSYGSNVP